MATGTITTGGTTAYGLATAGDIWNSFKVRITHRGAYDATAYVTYGNVNGVCPGVVGNSLGVVAYDNPHTGHYATNEFVKFRDIHKKYYYYYTIKGTDNAVLSGCTVNIYNNSGNSETYTTDANGNIAVMSYAYMNKMSIKSNSAHYQDKGEFAITPGTLDDTSTTTTANTATYNTYTTIQLTRVYYFYYKAVNSSNSALSGVVWSMKNGNTVIASGTTSSDGKMSGSTTATSTLTLNMTKTGDESITLNPASLSFTSGANSSDVTVTLTNTSYVNAVSSDSKWLTVSNLTNGKVKVSVTGRVEGETSDRSGKITFNGTSVIDYDAINNKSIGNNFDYSNVTMTLTSTAVKKELSVSQAKAAASGYISLSSTSGTVEPASGSTSFTVTLFSIKGNASVTSNVDWATVSPTNVANGGKVTITFKSNEGVDRSSRPATITVKGTDAVYGSTRTATYTLTQKAQTTYHYRGTVRISGTTTAIGSATVIINGATITANSSGQFSYSSVSNTTYTAKASKSGSGDSLTLTLGSASVGSGATTTTIKGSGTNITGNITLSESADWLSLNKTSIKSDNTDTATITISGQSYSAKARSHAISGSVASNVTFTEGSANISAGDAYTNYIYCPRKTVTSSVTLSQSSGTTNPEKTYYYYYRAVCDNLPVIGASYTIMMFGPEVPKRVSAVSDGNGYMSGSVTTTANTPSAIIDIVAKPPATHIISFTSPSTGIWRVAGSGGSITDYVEVIGTYSSYSVSSPNTWITISNNNKTFTAAAQDAGAFPRSGTVVYTTDTTTGYTGVTAKTITPNTSYTDITLTRMTNNASATLYVLQDSGAFSDVFKVKLNVDIYFNITAANSGTLRANPFVEMWLMDTGNTKESNIYGDYLANEASTYLDGDNPAYGYFHGALGGAIECEIDLPPGTSSVYLYILVRDYGWVLNNNNKMFSVNTSNTSRVKVNGVYTTFEGTSAGEYKAKIYVQRGSNDIQAIELGGWLS